MIKFLCKKKDFIQICRKKYIVQVLNFYGENIQMKKIKFKRIYKLIFISILIGYIICTFISQQKLLNIYKADEKRYNTLLEKANEKNTSLLAKKQNINSKEYIEEIARQKLDMYLPNERVYIDIGK